MIEFQCSVCSSGDWGVKPLLTLGRCVTNSQSPLLVVLALPCWLARVVASERLIYDTVEVHELQLRRSGFVVGPNAALEIAPLELLVNVMQNAPSHQQQGTCLDRNIATTDSDSVDTDGLAEIGGVRVTRRVGLRLGLRPSTPSQDDERIVRRHSQPSLVRLCAAAWNAQARTRRTGRLAGSPHLGLSTNLSIKMCHSTRGWIEYVHCP